MVKSGHKKSIFTYYNRISVIKIVVNTWEVGFVEFEGDFAKIIKHSSIDFIFRCDIL